MAGYDSDEELPTLSDLLVPLAPSGQPTALRRSPRKKNSTFTDTTRSPKKHLPSQKPSVAPKKSSPIKSLPANSKGNVRSGAITVPTFPRSTALDDITLTSNNRRSPPRPGKNLKITPVEPLFPLLAQNAGDFKSLDSETDAPDEPPQLKGARKSVMSRITEAARAKVPSQVDNIKRPRSNYASRFVLQEARCNDDTECSNDEEEDEDTDLSGFIVDDDAELSYHDSSDEEIQIPTKSQPAVRRRRLVRGSPVRRRHTLADGDSESEQGNSVMKSLTGALRDVKLDGNKTKNASEVEVIDLTSSPANSPRREPDVNLSRSSANTSSHPSNPFDDFDDILKFSPPSPRPEPAIPSKLQPTADLVDMSASNDNASKAQDDHVTPPATPPRSPSKLKSPSKLLSPSKRTAIPKSPHRQSMDAFWDHNVINEWNDVYSPKKAPTVSPKKLSRFTVWSDSESDSNDDDDDNDSADAENTQPSDESSTPSLPSPCSSPRKPRSSSPTKSENARLAAAQRKAAKEARAAFERTKHALAAALLSELDTHVTDSKLATLSASTGGVQLAWSNTLRTTAGRATWKRTVLTPSSEQQSRAATATSATSTTSTTRVQHFACIELAAKVIDSEARLVNTLAHEFCHLANFMVSGVRDAPHGASFQAWAARATEHLRGSNDPRWRDVRVTTKHDYVIAYKYLWVCSGGSSSPVADAEGDGGCGTEYGRHSRSIDVAKHRCGKCKGVLVQVRPRPRASPAKKQQPQQQQQQQNSKRGRTTSSTFGGAEEQGGTTSEGSQSSSGLGRRSDGLSQQLGSAIEVIDLSD